MLSPESWRLSRRNHWRLSPEYAFNGLIYAVAHEFRDHDVLVQALALHYHFASIHPFQDGNGRTARAVEARFLQRAGLRDALFIALSNYYYDEKTSYLKALSDVRANDHDLTPFLLFGLEGVTLQCRRLFLVIKKQVSKALYRNVMFDLFDRLKTGKRRVLAGRQVRLLKTLLEVDRMGLRLLYERSTNLYQSLKNPWKAFVRDLIDLDVLGAIGVEHVRDSDEPDIAIRLEWPTEITETKFFEQVKKMPKAKPHSLGI